MGNRNFSERYQIFKAKTVTPGSPLIVDTGFPFGGLIRWFDLHLHVTLTQTTASGAIADGLLRIIKNVVLRGGNDHFIKNCCGLFLGNFAQKMAGTALGSTTMATTTATTYSLCLPIYFADQRMDYPMDTAIDARRYIGTGLHFELLLGTVADLLTTPGDASIVVTADLYAHVEMGTQLPAVGAQGLPRGYRQYMQPAPFNPASGTTLELEKNERLFYRRLLVGAHNSATAGTPFSGTAANTTLASLTLKSNIRTHIDAVPEEDIRFSNKSEYQQEAVSTGIYLLDLLEGKSNFEMLPSDPKAITSLILQVENGTLSTSQVSVGVDTFVPY